MGNWTHRGSSGKSIIAIESDDKRGNWTHSGSSGKSVIDIEPDDKDDGTHTDSNGERSRIRSRGQNSSFDESGKDYLGPPRGGGSRVLSDKEFRKAERQKDIAHRDEQRWIRSKNVRTRRLFKMEQRRLNDIAQGMLRVERGDKEYAGLNSQQAGDLHRRMRRGKALEMFREKYYGPESALARQHKADIAAGYQRAGTPGYTIPGTGQTQLSEQTDPDYQAKFAAYERDKFLYELSPKLLEYVWQRNPEMAARAKRLQAAGVPPVEPVNPYAI